jgi:hypothetical protein
MVLVAIGSILGAAGSVASGIMSSINNKKALQAQQAEAARQQAYYETKANEDPLSKSSNQRLLNEYDRKSQKQMQAAQGVAAITGATPEYTLAVQKGVAEGRADLMGNISARHEATAEKALEQAELSRQQAAKAEQDRLAARNQTYANLAANAASAAGSMINGMQPKKVVNFQAELDELQKALDAGAIDQDAFDTRSSQLKTNWGKSITGSAVV